MIREWKSEKERERQDDGAAGGGEYNDNCGMKHRPCVR